MRFILQPENMIYKISSYEENYCILTPENILDTDIDYPVKRINESLLPLPMYDDNYIGEMATIFTNPKVGMTIRVNPDPGRIGNPYFKVYNSAKIKRNETSVVRLHFFDSSMEYHKDEYLNWVIFSDDVKRIKEILETEKDGITYWKKTCWKWNLEYNHFMLADDQENEYYAGLFDDVFKDHPSYVPSNILIPKTWIYDSSKEKNKRR